MPFLKVTSAFDTVEVTVVEVVSTSLKEAIIEMMKKNDPTFTHADEQNVRDHMESQRWIGGQWKVSPSGMSFDTDVGWTEFELI